MRSKSPFEISRACAANSSAAMRLRSRSSSLTGATTRARSSSCACSTFEIMTSICSFIFCRAKSSAPHIFATDRSTHRSGTSASMEK